MPINKFIKLENGYLDTTKIIGIWEQESTDYPYIIYNNIGRIEINKEDFNKLKQKLNLK